MLSIKIGQSLRAEGAKDKIKFYQQSFIDFNTQTSKILIVRTLMLNASSCSGVLNISGVKCSSNLAYRALEHKVKQNPGRTRPARPFRCSKFVLDAQTVA